MTVTVVQLEGAIAKELDVKKVDFDPRSGAFVCRCGHCNNMEVSGGTAQGLYERADLARLKRAHDKRQEQVRQALLKSTGYKQPAEQVLKWLAEDAKVDIRDLYRLMVVERKDDGGGVVILWLFCRNNEGCRYAGSEGQPARKSVKMTCQKLPGFIEDRYGWPIEKYGDKDELPGL